MVKSNTKRYLVLSILFFLPVIFLLFLYPAQHNYKPLDVVKENVLELPNSKEFKFKDHITVLAFIGKNPMDKVIAASNLKELVYDKFKGFKKFQIIAFISEDYKAEAETLRKEIAQYEDLKYWHFVFCQDTEIKAVYNSLKSNKPLDYNFSTEQVFIIDKDLNQRGRLDDRADSEIEKNKPVYGMYGYNCIEVSEIKNKMSDDMRILFTEYRQKRKGNFDSSSRRAEDLNKK